MVAQPAPMAAQPAPMAAQPAPMVAQPAPARRTAIGLGAELRARTDAAARLEPGPVPGL
jgi:hypothetical protein